MPRKKEPPAKAAAPTPWRGRLLKMTLLLLAVAVFLGGVIFLGQRALEQIRHQERYDIAFAEIQCTPPPGMTRAQFLDEIAKLSAPVKSFNLLDDNLKLKLQEAFQKHPAVEKIGSISVSQPRKIQVNLTFRPNWERYKVDLFDIQCTTPPNLSRAEFLDEIAYLSRVPTTLSFLDERLPSTLKSAFEKHPWVEKVDGVDVKPPREIHVRLTLRQPVLLVPTPDGLIAVDRHGVRMPKNAPTAGLPTFTGESSPPKGPAGTLWGDPKVEEAARKAAKVKS